MNDVNNSENQIQIILRDNSHMQICKTNGIKYTPDPIKHVYGISTRKPLEEIFLNELEFYKTNYPGYEIFTLGSSCVFGEKFITYLTICEFDLDSKEDFAKLKQALRGSDQSIRNKYGALWEWCIAGINGLSIAFVVGHLDFAYFLQHRKEFKSNAHSRYMSSFTNENTIIKSKDYKILHDGSIVPFDETKLSSEDDLVFKNYEKIQFEVISSGHPVPDYKHIHESK